MMETDIKNFIQRNSPDGGFLQSPEWKNFQESVGRKSYNISEENFYCNILEHSLPVVGKYFYIPRGPIVSDQGAVYREQLVELINLAKKNNAGWIRIEPATDEILEAIKRNTSSKIVKAPHDMQPKELFIIDITKAEEQLLVEMKPKTRYNIKIAKKRGVKVQVRENIDEFIRLTDIMSKRQGIATHPKEYYQKMCENCSSMKMYLAEYEGKIIAANLMVFFGHTCTYLHGASDDQYRNVMAPYLLQWQQILDARIAGCEKYDFGGVKINSTSGKSWAGVTRFKTGFSPNTCPTGFPGSYDIIISPIRYSLYRAIQKTKGMIR
ncbi:MAG TPA: peptidoglycan bridge formation glycyltransferase FemA/FemB family protein [Patescibacteria group bacterium]|nr:peptidoglycan bridge formation glycyltransferase FemA/FemB family protein [Patescibacteria group bacterium]